MSTAHPQRPAGPIRWPRVPRPGEESPQSGDGRSASLLDLDDDLAQECEPAARAAARSLTPVRVRQAELGPCDLEAWFNEVAGGPGLLVLDGLIAINTCVGDRAACELVGGGDLLQRFEPRAEELLTQRETCQVLRPASFALLDASFAARSGSVPQVGVALLRRAARRSAEAETLRAIASHPRLEVRLVLLLWHLASRWGKVAPAGIRLALPLTHRLLGQLVAAERPSVSHAMHRLAQTGLITGTACDLLLHGTLREHFEALREPLSEHADRPRLAVAARPT